VIKVSDSLALVIDAVELGLEQALLSREHVGIVGEAGAQ